MKASKRFFALLVFLPIPLLAAAQSAGSPSIKSGDEWTYQDTVESGAAGWKQTRDTVTVVRTTSSSIYYTVQASGAPTAPREVVVGPDWSRIRNVDGKETTVNRPLAFPLAEGKSWNVAYTEHNPNKIHTLEQWDNHFKVVGYETVEVPAGKFNAIKIEAEGQWVAEMAPANSVVQMANVTNGGTSMVTQTHRTTPVQTSGRLYKAFWYVPEVGRWVKSVEEYYSSADVRNQRFSSELESFKLSPRSAE